MRCVVWRLDCVPLLGRLVRGFRGGGQAQRLTVARVILQRPRVLILDEFTASVDPDLAAEIRVNLARCLPGVTVVEISHECDCGGETVVLDRGRVVKHLRR